MSQSRRGAKPKKKSEPKPRSDFQFRLDLCDYLNELFKADPSAIAVLVTNRVPCNHELANHPTCGCVAQHQGHHVGLLDIINGFLASRDPDGAGQILAQYDGPPQLGEPIASVRGFFTISEWAKKPQGT